MRNQPPAIGAPSPAANSNADKLYAGRVQDETPPPDHEGYLEVRQRGFRAMRARLERRRNRS
jgi:hypothetical protein